MKNLTKGIAAVGALAMLMGVGACASQDSATTARGTVQIASLHSG